jgi:hypothetical protein
MTNSNKNSSSKGATPRSHSSPNQPKQQSPKDNRRSSENHGHGLDHKVRHGDSSKGADGSGGSTSNAKK